MQKWTDPLILYTRKIQQEYQRPTGQSEQLTSSQITLR